MDQRNARQPRRPRKSREPETTHRWWHGRCVLQRTKEQKADSLGEGFKGQARVILPTITSCYECSLDMLNKPTAFPICTIANTPRLPEHCIEWASVLEWPRVQAGAILLSHTWSI